MKPESRHGSSILFVGGPEMAPLVADLDPASPAVDFSVEHRVASGSSEALAALARSEADVAVVDMTVDGLRGEDGWRRTREGWHRPIIVLCAEGDEACTRAALADGAEDALCHRDPSASTLVRRAISRALARARNVRPEVQLRDLRERWKAL